MFTVQCKCTRALSVSEEHCGKQGRCPSCGLLFVIPLPPSLATRQLACPCGNVMEYDIADAGLMAKCTRCPTMFRIPGGTTVSINKELSQEYQRKYARMVDASKKAIPESAAEISPIYDYVVDESYAKPFRMNLSVQVPREDSRANSWGIFGVSFFICSMALLIFAISNIKSTELSMGNWEGFSSAKTNTINDSTPVPASIPSPEVDRVPEVASESPTSSPMSADTKVASAESEDRLRRTGNLIKNGSFELPSVPPSESSTEIQSNRGELPGWLVGRFAIDVVEAGKVQLSAYDGRQFLDLDGTIGAGEVSQSFKTEPDVLYELSFLYATAPGTQSVGTVTIQSGDDTLVPKFQVKSATPNTSTSSWQLFRTEFRGNGRRAKLTITSLHDMQSKNGLAIDDVCVSPWKP